MRKLLYHVFRDAVGDLIPNASTIRNRQPPSRGRRTDATSPVRVRVIGVSSNLQHHLRLLSRICRTENKNRFLKKLTYNQSHGGSSIVTSRAFNSAIRTIEFSSNGHLTCLVCFSFATLPQVYVLQSQTLEVVFETLGRSVAFSPNENWMVVGGYTGEVSIFSTLDWNKISTIESRYSKSNFFRSVGASDRLSMVTGEIVRFTPDEKRILSGGPDGRISILAVPTLEELFTIVPSDSRLFDLAGVAAMQLDELGKMLLVGFEDAKLRLINLDSPTPLSLQHPKWHNSSPWELLGLLRWHRQQAERAEGIRDWHSASFHRAWQVRAFPRDAVAAY